MAYLYAVDGIVPVIDPTAFVSASATVIGDVIVGEACYIGPSACLRGDLGRIVLQPGSNVQDCCVLHGGPDFDTVVGANAIIGHGAVLHGCQVGQNALVGINSVVLDGAVIGEQALVAAMTFVKAGMIIPTRMLAMGVPARIVRAVSDRELDYLVVGELAYRDLATNRMTSVPQALHCMTPERERTRHARDMLPPT